MHSLVDSCICPDWDRTSNLGISGCCSNQLHCLARVKWLGFFVCLFVSGILFGILLLHAGLKNEQLRYLEVGEYLDYWATSLPFSFLWEFSLKSQPLWWQNFDLWFFSPATLPSFTCPLFSSTWFGNFPQEKNPRVNMVSRFKCFSSL